MRARGDGLGRKSEGNCLTLIILAVCLHHADHHELSCKYAPVLRGFGEKEPLNRFGALLSVRINKATCGIYSRICTCCEQFSVVIVETIVNLVQKFRQTLTLGFSAVRSSG
ncbi:hypothetical protein RB195_026484 [Necator americanus]|uniref:Secreted protein n=1 Tax=Necator americanus TaxID=51031 RepID=A0ABR1EX88_NECAM